MIEILKAILYGIVEGITEWLPISSTGHMILLDEFVKLNVSAEFWNMFLVVVQLGAILAVVILFWKKIWPFGRKNNPHPVSDKGLLSYCKKDVWVLWFKIIVACLPAIAVVALGLDEWFEERFYNGVSVAIALIAFGIGFIVIENINKNKKAKIVHLNDLSYGVALVIGLWQLVAALFPGTSRSGATILGALLIGVSRTVAAEFTFFLAIPVMFGSSLLELLDFGFAFTGLEFAILAIGMITAFIVSVVVIKFLLSYIRKHDFKVFGWYRIILGAIVLTYFLLK